MNIDEPQADAANLRACGPDALVASEWDKASERSEVALAIETTAWALGGERLLGCIPSGRGQYYAIWLSILPDSMPCSAPSRTRRVAM
jgi:hypothetical protein